MTKQKTAKKGRIFFIFIIIIVIPAIWFLFLNKDHHFEQASDKLTGKWLRADDTYSIGISNVAKQGNMTAAYFNPNPIHVEKSEWSMKDEKLQVYVEMNDVNYEGSNYKLTYIEETDQLVGFYYQATMQQTFDVIFNRK